MDAWDIDNFELFSYGFKLFTIKLGSIVDDYCSRYSKSINVVLKYKVLYIFSFDLYVCFHFDPFLIIVNGY